MGKKLILTLLVLVVLVNVTATLIYLSKPSITGRVVLDVVDKPSGIESNFVGNKYVSKIIDGDTVIIEGSSVRLLGMDTDERGYPCFSEAKKRIEELILDKEVILELDGEDTDRYGRYLRYIFLDGRNINLQLVEEGFAVARFSPKNSKYKEEILQAEKNAREEKIGCKWEEIVEEADEDNVEENQEDNVQNIGESNEQENPPMEQAPNQEYICDRDTYNCGDFSTHEEAQSVFDSCGGIDNDIHRLDNNKDGVACQSLL